MATFRSDFFPLDKKSNDNPCLYKVRNKRWATCCEVSLMAIVRWCTRPLMEYWCCHNSTDDDHHHGILMEYWCSHNSTDDHHHHVSQNFLLLYLSFQWKNPTYVCVRVCGSPNYPKWAITFSIAFYKERLPSVETQMSLFPSYLVGPKTHTFPVSLIF